LALRFVQECMSIIGREKPVNMGWGMAFVLGTCPNTILRCTK
jgi:hypothetical protein